MGIYAMGQDWLDDVKSRETNRGRRKVRDKKNLLESSSLCMPHNPSMAYHSKPSWALFTFFVSAQSGTKRTQSPTQRL